MTIGNVIDVYAIKAKDGEPTTVKGEIKGLNPGLHGFHVHQYGDMSDGCTSAGPHLNPFNKTHGGPKVIEKFKHFFIGRTASKVLR